MTKSNSSLLTSGSEIRVTDQRDFSHVSAPQLPILGHARGSQGGAPKMFLSRRVVRARALLVRRKIDTNKRFPIPSYYELTNNWPKLAGFVGGRSAGGR